jgi:Zn-dependent protease
LWESDREIAEKSSMRKTITYGHVSGIPLRVHWNWFPVAILVALSFSAGYFPLRNSDWPNGVYWVVGFITTFLFFGSVVVHELAHALVAIREGVGVKSITLFIFGGAAHMDHEPHTAGSDFRIVAAGPLANIALGILYFAAAYSTADTPTIREATHYLSNMNFMLAGFNLIPGFPLDGGRIIRALLWKLTGSLGKATRLAAGGGYLVAGIFVSAGIPFFLFKQAYSGTWSILIGVFLAYITYDSVRRAKQAGLQAIHNSLSGVSNPIELDFQKGT